MSAGPASAARSPSCRYRIVDEAGADVADDTPGELLVRAAGRRSARGFFTKYLGRSARPPKRPGKAAGSTPATWCGGTRTATVLRRSSEERDPPQRREHRRRRSGKRAAPASAGARRRVRRRARRPARRGSAGLHRSARSRSPTRHVPPRTSWRMPCSELAYFKAPGYVAFVDALPLTATNKVQRGELKAWAQRASRHSRTASTRAI